MFYSEKDDREKQLRFSIRKVSFGAASVAVAALYLFMGSGAVSAAEAQAVQSNEEVAADKDSETEEQQPTYAAPAAKEQGSATNTEAGDEGKQESHPETKEEEANSSERSETTTKTRSDENSVSGDSSSPKSTEDSEGTRSEEASNKPKVRKRRDAPAPTATPTDDDPAANQTYTAPEDGASVDDLATKLKVLSETVENEKKLANIDQVGDTKSISPGQVSELDEFGGWKAVSADGAEGKFAVARKTAGGVFPIETVNVTRDVHSYTAHVEENSFDRSHEYALFLSKVRTYATRNEETFDKEPFKDIDTNGGRGEARQISKGLKGFNGIEKTYKAYSSSTGTGVNISFKTGFTGDIDGYKAGYKVEVIAKLEDGMMESIYSQSFRPDESINDTHKNVVSVNANDRSKFTVARSPEPNIDKLNQMLAEHKDNQGNRTGIFTSKSIVLPKGATEYTVKISASDNSKLGMGYQVPWKHYALPIVGTGFSVTQDTSEVAKDLSQKVHDKLIAQKEEDTKWSTPETKAAYDEKLQKIKEKIDSGASTTSNYKDVVADAVEQWKKLNDGQKIKDKAKKAIEDKLKEKEKAIDNNDKLSPAEKDKAKEAAKKAAEDAKQAITNANSQDEVTNKQTEGTKAIGDVNPIGTENAVNAIAEAAAVKMAEIEDDETLSEDEKKAAKAKLEAAVTKAGQAIKKAKDAKNQDGVDQAQADALSEVTAINPVGKDKATKAIEDKLKEKEEAIDNNNKLSPREKAAAKDQAKQAADRAKEAITNALTQDEVNKQETEGTTAINNVNPIGKDKAKKAIEDKLKEKEAEIDNNSKLSPAEKEAAKKQAQAAADKAKEAITNANSQAEVTEKETEGTKAIDDVNPIGTDMAVDAIAEAAARRMAEIDDDETLSEDEKSIATEEVVEAVRKAGEAIRKAKEAKNQDDVDKAQADAISEVTAVKPVAKDKAKKAIADKLKEKETEIDNNNKLSPAEKETAKEAAKKAAEDAIQAINDAQTQDDVNMKEAEGTAAIGNVNPVGKDKAKKAIEDKLKEKEAEIDNNSKLSPAEKEAAKKQAQAAADKAKEAITNANSQAEVTEKETEGTKAIDDVNPIGTDMAVDAIAEAAARKMAEIDDNDELSEDEKKAAKAKVEEAVTKAAQAIKKAKDAKDQGGVDKAQEDALSEVTAVKPVAKDKAKADLEKAAQAEKAAIAADKSLTAAQRAEKEQAVDAAKAAAEAKIDSAADADKVAEAKTAGETAIAGVHTNGDLEALKKAAKADLDKAAETEKAEINADTSLTSTEKEQKVKDLEAKLAEEKAKIDSAADADKVAEAKTAGETAIAG
ncbi:DUF1542 domain-containing protein, partial [Streptococcus pseudopneumoniae]